MGSYWKRFLSDIGKIFLKLHFGNFKIDYDSKLGTKQGYWTASLY